MSIYYDDKIDLQSNSDVITIVNTVLEKIEDAIEKRDIELWMKVFKSDDDIVKDAQTSWFSTYFTQLVPSALQLQVLELDKKEEEIVIRVKMNIQYVDYDDVSEVQLYGIQFVESMQDWCIVWYEKTRKAFMQELGLAEPICLCDEETPDETNWWENESLLEAAKDSNDALSEKIYARAVTRSIRFREAHPELECASILANIMSYRVNKLSLQLYHNDPVTCLSRVYNALKDLVQVKLVRTDRDNTWSSKFVVPWFGYDELFMMRNEQGIIHGSCSSYMSLLASIMRLGGFATDDVIQLRFGNQDAVMFSSDDKNFLLTSEALNQLTERTIYYKDTIDKAFTDSWYVDSYGRSNLSQEEKEDSIATIRNRASIFHFDVKESKKNTAEDKNRMSLVIPDLNSIKDTYELNQKLKIEIFERSKAYPDSIYTWAKYAYQTIWVTKPEAYVVWSMQSNVVKMTFENINTMEELLEYVLSLKEGSIFMENDRFMTADQVIRHDMADAKARALLLFTWLKLKTNQTACMAFTDKACYCIWREENIWEIYNTNSRQICSSIEGELLLAFDHTYSYFPLIKHGELDSSKADWVETLNKL